MCANSIFFETDPLAVAPGARIIDSTSMTLEEVIRTVVDEVREEV